MEILPPKVQFLCKIGFDDFIAIMESKVVRGRLVSK